MNFEQISDNKSHLLEGPLLLTNNIFSDDRGFFYESWNEDTFNQSINTKTKFVQDNISSSKKNVLRGLHFQLAPKEQGKLVSVLSGSIYDVIVDLRLNSSNFSNWAGINLNEENKNQLWVPKGFAHGFFTLSSIAIVQYKVTNYWSQSLERSLRWDDDTINIKWPMKDKNLLGPIISKKDKEASSLNQLRNLNEVFA